MNRKLVHALLIVIGFAIYFSTSPDNNIAGGMAGVFIGMGAYGLIFKRG